MLPAHCVRFYARRGQAALAMVLLIGGVSLVIAVSVFLISTSLANSVLGFRDSNSSLAVATAGVNDALLQLARHKDFASGSGYLVPLTDSAATVTVNQNSPTSNQATIISSGSVGLFQSKLKVVVGIASTGQVTVLSWQKIL